MFLMEMIFQSIFSLFSLTLLPLDIYNLFYSDIASSSLFLKTLTDDELTTSQDVNTNNQSYPTQRVTSLEQLSWYHGELNRTATETLLLQHDVKVGTYLLRKSQRHEGFTVSVRCQGSVKHFILDYNNRINKYKFANTSFSLSPPDLLNRFESCPMLTKENEIPVTLIQPYNIGGEDERNNRTGIRKRGSEHSMFIRDKIHR